MEIDLLPLPPDFSVSRGIVTYSDGSRIYLPLGPLGPAYAICRTKTAVALVFDYIFLAAMFWCVYVLHLIGRPMWWSVGIPVLLFVLMRTWIFPTLILLKSASKKPSLTEYDRVVAQSSHMPGWVLDVLLLIGFGALIGSVIQHDPQTAIAIAIVDGYIASLSVRRRRAAKEIASSAMPVVEM